MDDDPWAEYARLQKYADSAALNNRAWGIDDALDAILDKIEAGGTVSPDQADNIVTNRAGKHRRRRNLLSEKGFALIFVNETDEEERIFVRSRLRQCFGRCSERERQVLVSVGLGETYSEMAVRFGVPAGTVKTWVHRTRLRLAA